jgi:hypothetical protein
MNTNRLNCTRLSSVIRLSLFAALSVLFAVPAFSLPPPLRILPLGDSITYGSSVAGGYRLPLYTALTALGYNVDFVGSALR